MIIMLSIEIWLLLLYQNDISNSGLPARAGTLPRGLDPPQGQPQGIPLHSHHLPLDPLLGLLPDFDRSHQPQRPYRLLPHRSVHSVNSFPSERSAACWWDARSHPCADADYPDNQEVGFILSRKFIYYISGVSLIVCGLSLVPQLLVLVLSRFLLGVLNGLQMSLASAFIKEVFPSHIRKPLGGIYSTSRIFGMLTCYFIAEMSGYTFSDAEHILTFLGPAIICITQSILFYALMPDSIVEMITKKQEERAKQCLAKFYTAANIDRRYQQMKM